MQQLLRRTMVVAFLLLQSDLTAQAWNSTGHMVACKIAYDNLKEKPRQRILALLRKHRAFETFLPGEPGRGLDPDQYAFMKASTWPDMIRSRSNPMHREHHRPKYHFINFPFALDGIAAPRPAVEAGDVDNIVKALKQCVDTLSSQDANEDNKAIQLAWFLHLAGDIHQPLHCTSLISNQFPLPDGDRGGNRFLIIRRSGRIALHTMWDQALGGAQSPRILEFLARKIQSNPEFQRDKLVTELGRSTFVEWADESFKIAREVVYDGGMLRGVNEEELRDDPDLEIPLLPEGYEEQMIDVARKRLALAGYRMADRLNALFADP